MPRSTLLCLALVAIGCSDSGGEKASPPAAEEATPVVIDAGPVDAQVAAPAVGVKAADLHFDDYGGEVGLRARPSTGARQGEIELLLRSTPPGAVAAIDGRRIGVTPVLWRTTRSGQANEFTFVLPGYAMARYRFVPTRSGIVHGTLKKLAEPAPDAGPPPKKSSPQRKR